MEQKIHGVSLSAFNTIILPSLMRSGLRNGTHLMIVAGDSELEDVIGHFIEKNKHQVIKDKIKIELMSRSGRVVFANDDVYEFRYGRDIKDSMRGFRFETVTLVR